MEINTNKEIFARNLQKYMDNHNINRNILSQKTDIPYTTICDWLSAKKYPRIDKVELLANFFNIEKSDLIEDKLIKEKPREEIDILFDRYRSVLTESDINLMKTIMINRMNEIDKKLDKKTDKKGD